MKNVNFDQFVEHLDTAMQAHLAWSRRILRCAVLRTNPGEDALNQEAHTLCQFGNWLKEDNGIFIKLDKNETYALEETHKNMHDAIRNISSDIMNNKPGKTKDLECFETAQSMLYKHISYFKNIAITRSSKIDSLTGLPLRHYMSEDFEALTQLSKRTKNKVGVVILDIDDFKVINDRYGHTMGDFVIQRLAEVIKEAHRKNEFSYRYGGEEFLLLVSLSELNALEELHLFANRLLKTVRDVKVLKTNDEIIQFTVTIGISIVENDEGLQSSIERADVELYNGKNSGRDCYMIAI